MPNNTVPEIHKIDTINILPQENFILDNGVKVLSFFNNDINALKLDFAFPAGRIFQKKAFQSSICNAILREGTNQHPDSAEIEEKLDYFGIFVQQRIEAYWGIVSFYVPLMYLDKALPIIHEILFDAIIDDPSTEFLKDKARSVLIKNLKKPDFIAKSEGFSWLWGKNHPMGTYPDPSDLDNLSRTDLLDFYRKYYKEAKFNIYISGNFPKDLIKEINVLFGQHKITKVSDSLPEREYNKPRQIHQVEEKQVQTALYWIAPCIGPEHKDYFDFKIMNTVFGDYFGSRLMTNIREEKAYTYGIYSGINPRIAGTNITIQTEVGKEYLEDTISQINHEIDRMRNELIQNEELELIRNYMSGELLSVFDGVFHHASVLRYLDEMNMDFSYYKNYIQRIQNITANDILKAAQNHLSTENFHKVYIG